MGKVLIVHAHPDPKSLTSALKNVAVRTLVDEGHEVEVSDLYAMRWKAIADGDDFTERLGVDRLFYSTESHHAFATGTQSADIVAEQNKLLWADAVILNFPLWWFGLPAILKGWVDRVFACGFAYGVGRHNGNRWGNRYGEGTLRGRRAMLSITIGGRAAHYSPRGVNGQLDDVLWPIQHGILYYTGLSVIPPYALYQTQRLNELDFPEIEQAYSARIARLFTEDPIAYRMQNGGHYDDEQVLRPGLGEGQSGTRIHIRQPGEPAEQLVPDEEEALTEAN